MNLKSKLFLLLKIILSLIIIGYLVYRIGINNIAVTFSKLNIYVLLFAIGIIFLHLIIAAYSVFIFIKPFGYRLKFLDFLKVYLFSYSFGLFLPGKIGEFSIIPLLKSKNIEYKDSAAFSILDKLITFITLFSFTVIGVFIFLSFKNAIYIISILLVIFFILFFFLFSKFGRDLIIKLVLRKYAEKFNGFSNSVHFISNQKRLIFINFLLTILKWLVLAFAYYFLFKDFTSIQVSFFYVFLIAMMSTLISLIPISLSGLGIRESVAVFLFGAIGISSVVTFNVYLVLLVISYSYAAIFLWIYKSKY